MSVFRKKYAARLTMFALVSVFVGSHGFAQAFPPGTFAIDGIPVNCGTVTTVLNRNLPDVGTNDLRGHITINPVILSAQPTVLKLFWYAHECGHSVVGADESAADCWAIKTGKRQDWFPPDAFSALEAAFAYNPGDWTHLPGPARVQHIKECYGIKSDESSSDDQRNKNRDDDDNSDDPLSCGEAYNSCIENITSLDDCVQRKRRGCMRDCLSNYRYGRTACEERLCNPEMGTNGRWEETCSRRIKEEKADCASERGDCRARGAKRKPSY